MGSGGEPGKASGAFSQALTGLTPGTTYYYRSFAGNSADSDWADSSASFTTLDASTVTAPTVVNAPASGVGVTVATLNGEVTDTAGEAPAVTIYYGTSDAGPTTLGWDASVSVGGGAGQPGTFAEMVTGLSASTTYHYRAHAVNSADADWSDSAESFTTSAGGGGGGDVEFMVRLDTNNDLTGGTANGSVWGAGGGTTERDGITSVNLTGYPGNGATATISFTAEVTDPGHELFGLKISYDVVASAFTDDGAGNLSPSTVDNGSALGVRSSLSGQQDNEIDAVAKLTAGGAFEFLRMSLANVSVLADPNNVLDGGTVAADGFVGHTIRHQGETPNAPTGEAGRVLQAGTGTVLGPWGPDAEGYRDVILWTTPNTTDIVADGEEGALQGFRAQFTAITGGTPSDPYGDWAGMFAGLTDPDPTLDFDKGGLPTGIEWVTGGNPSDGGDDAGLLPTGYTSTAPDEFLFVFRRADEAEADANTTIAVEYGVDLTNWRNTIDHGLADGVTTTVVDDGFDTGVDRVTVAIPRSLEVGGALFARLKVTIAEP